MVVGPGGEEIWCDKYGRVKVQFHWDRYGKKDENSSCWIRVAHQWAGGNWGVISLPRIGQEVIVDFLEGDPDQPIIVGSVYNADQMPPYALPANTTQSGIKSRSSKGGGPANFNEIRFEDKKGSEQLFIHAEKNQDIEVENDETHWVGHDRKKTIDHDETTHVKHDRTETVDNNETITIHGEPDGDGGQGRDDHHPPEPHRDGGQGRDHHDPRRNSARENGRQGRDHHHSRRRTETRRQGRGDHDPWRPHRGRRQGRGDHGRRRPHRDGRQGRDHLGPGEPVGEHHGRRQRPDRQEPDHHRHRLHHPHDGLGQHHHEEGRDDQHQGKDITSGSGEIVGKASKNMTLKAQKILQN